MVKKQTHKEIEQRRKKALEKVASHLYLRSPRKVQRRTLLPVGLPTSLRRARCMWLPTAVEPTRTWRVRQKWQPEASRRRGKRVGLKSGVFVAGGVSQGSTHGGNLSARLRAWMSTSLTTACSSGGRGRKMCVRRSVGEACWQGHEAMGRMGE